MKNKDLISEHYKILSPTLHMHTQKVTVCRMVTMQITAVYSGVKISFEKANDNTTYSAYTANHNQNTDTTPLLGGWGVKDRYSTSNSQKQKL